MEMDHFEQVGTMKKGFASCVLSLLSFYTLVSLKITHGFNIDVPSAITHHGPSGSMFGFSVAQHRDSNQSWILVGAPQANSDHQPGLRQPGAVFRCSCVQGNSCQQLPFDRNGNNVVDGKQMDEKSSQWFGATVRSSGEDGIILACAPRYVWFSSNRKRRDPVGTCFVAKDSFTEFTEYSPCRTSRWGYHRQGSCQLGLGGDLDGRRIFVGAVGSWYWQGQVFMIDSRKSTEESRVPFYQFPPPGQLYSQNVGSRPDIKWTKEGPSWDDDSYLGYSVVHGEFSGDNDSDVAVGMPRGANLTGKVVIYSSDLTNLHNITGEQIGAYFGYSMCVLDVDGDGLDDIVVGSPMYTDYNDPSMKIETGRVYIIYQTKKHKFRKWESIDGRANQGRFGLALTSLGDINKDGFEGSPYDEFEGRGGAVYIFQGSSTGAVKEFTQVIYGSSVSYGISTTGTFGFSLSGGKDLDGNNYPDLLVGAYDSNTVAYLRAKPVVRVKSKLSFSAPNKQVNLDEKRCTLRDLTPVTCVPLQLCMEYDGEGADDVIDFNVQYTLDSKKPNDPRMYFKNYEGLNTINETIRLTKRREQCVNQEVYLRPLIRDKLTSLEADMKCSLRADSRYRQRDLLPVIDVTTSSAEKDSISIQKNCGPDNVCVPDLRLAVNQTAKSYLMGSKERIYVDVDVYNNGEDSYESMMYMTVPQGLFYVNYEERKTDPRKDISILCSPPSLSTNNTIKCDIGNPLPTYSSAKFRVIFSPRDGTEFKSTYDFRISVNSTNPEEIYAQNDNWQNISIPIRVHTDLKLFGVSKEAKVSHNASQWKQYAEYKDYKSETEIGPEVYHIYDVKCQGPSHIEKAEVTIVWPSYLADSLAEGENRHFMYLLEQPRVDGQARCDYSPDVNPLALTTLYRRWDSIIVPSGQENKVTVSSTSVIEAEEDLIDGGEGRRSGGSFSGSFSRGGGTSLNEGFENGRGHDESSSQREYHSEHRSSAHGGYGQSYNYTHSYQSEVFSKSGSSKEYKEPYSPSQYPYPHYPPPNSINRYRRGLDEQMEKESSCGPTECIKIRCYIDYLASGSSVLFMLRSRVFSKTIVEAFHGEHVNVSSKLIARVTALPYNVDPSYLRFRKYEIVTSIEEVPDLSVPSAIPWWVYLLAAIAGLLLLLLIIFILYKCGFFRRRRPGRGTDSQPESRGRGR